MKSVTSMPLGILSAILLCACAETGEPITDITEAINYKSISLTAANKANQYDYYIGARYTELLTAYKAGD